MTTWWGRPFYDVSFFFRHCLHVASHVSLMESLATLGTRDLPIWSTIVAQIRIDIDESMAARFARRCLKV